MARSYERRSTISDINHKCSTNSNASHKGHTKDHHGNEVHRILKNMNGPTAFNCTNTLIL
jgi:hypothetical protein